MTKPEATLAGLFFMWDHGESYQTGAILRQVNDDAYLVLFDVLAGEPAINPMFLLDMDDFTDKDETGYPAFRFFDTREELDRFVVWIRTPLKDTDETVAKGKRH